MFIFFDGRILNTDYIKAIVKSSIGETPQILVYLEGGKAPGFFAASFSDIDSRDVVFNAMGDDLVEYR